MHLVDDEHLVAVPHRRERQVVDDDFANRVDTGVAGRVDLEHVDVAPLRDLDARIAHAARLDGRPFYAVQRPRQNPGRRRLAGSALACEHEGLRDAAAGDGIAQRARDRLLSDDVIEPLRTPLACENLVHKWKSRKVEKWSFPLAMTAPTAARYTCGTPQGLFSAAAFRP